MPGYSLTCSYLDAASEQNNAGSTSSVVRTKKLAKPPSYRKGPTTKAHDILLHKSHRFALMGDTLGLYYRCGKRTSTERGIIKISYRVKMWYSARLPNPVSNGELTILLLEIRKK